MGFSDQEIVALSGAHNLGRCHSDRSGFHGAWVNNPTRFSNQYFVLMQKLEWKRKVVPESGVEQFVNYDEDTETELMMLPTDMALLEDESFRPWVKRYAEDKEAFFGDFARVFAKLIELGIRRDEGGRITNSDNVGGGYHSAPKKRDTAGAPGRSNEEADPLRKENETWQKSHGEVKAKL